MFKRLPTAFAVVLITLICIGILSESASLKYGQECKTTRDEIGKCTSINSCPAALSIILAVQNGTLSDQDASVQELRHTKCGFNQGVIYVCCPVNGIEMNARILDYLNSLDCGISTKRRVANGERAHILAYRWMVLLKYQTQSVFDCGGSLISHRYVLTAAHCFSPDKIPIAVRLGEYNLETETDCSNKMRSTICLPAYIEIGIQNTFTSHEYIYGGIYYDIALIRLERRVEFGKGIQPICLPTALTLQSKVPDWYIATGWGRTESGRKSSVLLEVTLPGQSLAFCQSNLPIVRGSLDSGHICAGGANLRDTCKGDSGGPLFSSCLYTDGTIRIIQFGIVSFGMPQCGRTDAPAIYTNVSHYMQWILDHFLLDY